MNFARLLTLTSDIDQSARWRASCTITSSLCLGHRSGSTSIVLSALHASPAMRPGNGLTMILGLRFFITAYEAPRLDADYNDQVDG